MNKFYLVLATASLLPLFGCAADDTEEGDDLGSEEEVATAEGAQSGSGKTVTQILHFKTVEDVTCKVTVSFNGISGSKLGIVSAYGVAECDHNISNWTQHDPVFLTIVAPDGSKKSESVDTYRRKRVYLSTKMPFKGTGKYTASVMLPDRFGGTIVTVAAPF